MMAMSGRAMQALATVARQRHRINGYEDVI
jgi:hypothetical protein